MSYPTDNLVIDGHTDTHTHTHAGNDNTRRPKLASGKNNTETKRVWNDYTKDNLYKIAYDIWEMLNVEFRARPFLSGMFALQVNNFLLIENKYETWVIQCLFMMRSRMY